MSHNTVQIETLFEYFIVMFSRNVGEKEQEDLMELAKSMTLHIN